VREPAEEVDRTLVPPVVVDLPDDLTALDPVTPSRVRPVSSKVCGSTSRMYQRHVSSSPSSIPATRSSMPPEAPSTVSTRLSMYGVTGWPVRPAE
jgi:hypothetical protein